jgi:PAS domain S-box-containing protein
MKLKDIMNANPVVLREDTTLLEAAGIFVSKYADCAPVVGDHGALRGLFSARQINKALSAGSGSSVTVGELMLRDVITGAPEDDISTIRDFTQGQLPIVDNGKVVGIISRTDYTTALAEFNEKIYRELGAIINSTSYMIISIDAAGTINVFNRSAEAILKLDPAVDPGKHSINDIFPDMDVPSLLKHDNTFHMRRIEVRGQPFIFSAYPNLKNGAPAGAVLRFQDISELEAISHELENVRELNRDLDAIIESSHDGIWVTDGEGNVLRINRAYAEITGLPCPAFYGRNMKDLVDEGYFSESVTMHVLEKKKPYTIIQETNTGSTLLVTGNPVFNAQGAIERVVTNVRDVTEIKLLMERLDRSQKLSEMYKNEINSLRLQYAGMDKMVANSNRMRKLMELVVRVAQYETTVLITGESGTGKELIAEALHSNSLRASMPFIKVNCGAIPENLLESEMFGYDSGAFTGARKGGKAGYFELASGGTLFLDEIGELPIHLQAKFLRVLEQDEVTRIGGERARKIDVRVITATNRDLFGMVGGRQFREDLYYRLKVVQIDVPPLRERKDDIPYLAIHFVQVLNHVHKLAKRMSPEVVDMFMEHDWPGNIRELKNLIESVVITTPEDYITAESLPFSFQKISRASRGAVEVSSVMPLRDAIESVEKQMLEKLFRRGMTVRQMADELNVNASTIVRKAAKYGICRDICKEES